MWRGRQRGARLGFSTMLRGRRRRYTSARRTSAIIGAIGTLVGGCAGTLGVMAMTTMRMRKF